MTEPNQGQSSQQASGRPSDMSLLGKIAFYAYTTKWKFYALGLIVVVVGPCSIYMKRHGEELDHFAKQEKRARIASNVLLEESQLQAQLRGLSTGKDAEAITSVKLRLQAIDRIRTLHEKISLLRDEIDAGKGEPRQNKQQRDLDELEAQFDEAWAAAKFLRDAHAEEVNADLDGAE